MLLLCVLLIVVCALPLCERARAGSDWPRTQPPSAGTKGYAACAGGSGSPRASVHPWQSRACGQDLVEFMVGIVLRSPEHRARARRLQALGRGVDGDAKYVRGVDVGKLAALPEVFELVLGDELQAATLVLAVGCLLYTSDAADE